LIGQLRRILDELGHALFIIDQVQFTAETISWADAVGGPMTSTTPLPPITGEHAAAPGIIGQRRLLRERQIYSVLDRLLALVQILFGIGTMVALMLEALSGGPDSRAVEFMLGIPVMVLTVVAGVLLWGGRRAGIALSLGLQLFQIFPVVIAHTAVRYVAGLQWTLRFGGPRIWKPWGFEGTFLVLHDPAFPATMIGFNVVAFVAGLYLASRLRDIAKTHQ
jgi:hypothetical protein